ncbi:MAG: SPOR domain-containing protein [Thermotaleaceae bacterium]
MRQTRIKTGRAYKERSLGMTLLFMLILPIISVVVGYLSAKYMIIPKLSAETKSTTDKESIAEMQVQQEKEAQQQTQNNSTERSQTTEEAYASTFEIQGFSIYGIQLGSFTTQDNAKALASDLAAKNLGTYIWNNDGYKVLTLALTERADADKILPKMKQYDENAYIVTTNVPIRAVKYDKEDAKYTLLFSNANRELISVYQQISKEIAEAHVNNTMNLQDIVQKQLQELKDIKNEIGQSPPTANLQNIHKEYNQLLDHLILGLEEILTINSEKGFVKIQDTLTKSLYDYYKFATSSAY